MDQTPASQRARCRTRTRVRTGTGNRSHRSRRNQGHICSFLGSWGIPTQSLSHWNASRQQILGELLAPNAGLDGEAGVEESGEHLHRVQLAVAVEGEADDLPPVALVPGHSAATRLCRLAGLREELVEQSPFCRQHYAFAKVWRDVQRHYLVIALRRCAGPRARLDVASRWSGWRHQIVAIANAILAHAFQLLNHRCGHIDWSCGEGMETGRRAN